MIPLFFKGVESSRSLLRGLANRSVPRCEQPDVPEFADQVARVELRYTVAERGFFDAYKDLILAGLGVLFAAFVLYGFIRPHSFGPGDRMRIAGDARSLTRASKMPLRGMPGGRKGWYRSARVCIGAGGNRLKSTRRALFVIHARPEGPVLTTRTQVRTQNPRTRRMEDVAIGSDGLSLRGTVTYQIGEMFVRMS